MVDKKKEDKTYYEGITQSEFYNDVSTRSGDDRLTNLEKQVIQLTRDTRELGRAVRQLVEHMDTHTNALMQIVQNRSPEGTISLSDHRKIVANLLWAYTTGFCVILGVKELITYIQP